MSSIVLAARSRRVRQAGCHVVIVPHDWTKIAVWVRILDLANAVLSVVYGNYFVADDSTE